MPIAGDRRSADNVIRSQGFEALVEAETHLDDIQALERAIAGKQRDIGTARVVLLVSDTRHNRSVISRVEELRRRFPIGTRDGLTTLSRDVDPGSDCLVAL